MCQQCSTTPLAHSLLPKKELLGLTVSSGPPLRGRWMFCWMFLHVSLAGGLQGPSLSTLALWGSSPSHGYKHNLRHAAEFPIHISSSDLSTKLQVYTSAFYPLFLLRCLIPILKLVFQKQSIWSPPHRACSTSYLTHPCNMLRSRILDSTISLSFISIPSGNVPSDCSHNLMPPHKLPFNHPVLSHILIIS